MSTRAGFLTMHVSDSNKVRGVLRYGAVAIVASLIGPFSVAGTDPATLIGNENDGANWPAYGRSYSETHASPLREITNANIARLGLAWSLDLPDIRNGATVPLA